MPVLTKACIANKSITIPHHHLVYGYNNALNPLVNTVNAFNPLVYTVNALEDISDPGDLLHAVPLLPLRQPLPRLCIPPVPHLWVIYLFMEAIQLGNILTRTQGGPSVKLHIPKTFLQKKESTDADKVLVILT